MAAKLKSARKRSDKESVGVFVRLKPIKDIQPQSIVQINSQQLQTVSPDGSSTANFSFTHIFDQKSTQKDVFDMVARPIVEESITEANNGLIFTYGVTSSGKTYTMEGCPKDPGLIIRTVDFVFNSIDGHQVEPGMVESNGQNGYRIHDYGKTTIYPSANLQTPMSKMPSYIKWLNRRKDPASVKVDSKVEYAVFVSLVELYNKQIVDLIDDSEFKISSSNKKKLEIREEKDKGLAYVANVNEREVRNADDAIELFIKGLKRRSVAETKLNSESSRSHCVFTIKLVQVRKNITERFEYPPTVSQVCLVDLAGSERAKRSHATGGTLHEAGNINNSLGALRKCIKALRDKQFNAASIPQYRDHNLTRLFKSYFNGLGTVKMILCINPTEDEYLENKFAMEFGLVTKDVAIEYTSPQKVARRSSRYTYDDTNLELLIKEKKKAVMNPNLNEASDFLRGVNEIKKLERIRDKRLIEEIRNATTSFRVQLVNSDSENAQLERKYKTMRLKLEEFQSRPTYIHAPRDYPESSASSIDQISDQNSYAPCAPQEYNETYSAEDHESNTANDIENDDDMDPRGSLHASASKATLTSPREGRGVANPRHNRSLSTGSMPWIHHKPSKIIKTGTAFQCKVKHAKSVRKLRSSDILGKDTGVYSVLHQSADPKGKLTTSVWKGQIIPTKGGGAQVIFNDVERMDQASPVENDMN